MHHAYRTTKWRALAAVPVLTLALATFLVVSHQRSASASVFAGTITCQSKSQAIYIPPATSTAPPAATSLAPFTFSLSACTGAITQDGWTIFGAFGVMNPPVPVVSRNCNTLKPPHDVYATIYWEAIPHHGTIDVLGYPTPTKVHFTNPTAPVLVGTHAEFSWPSGTATGSFATTAVNDTEIQDQTNAAVIAACNGPGLGFVSASGSNGAPPSTIKV